MKVGVILALLGGLILVFQNCGETARSTGILAQSEVLLQSQCPNNQCLAPADYLWMTIRDYEPYRIEISTLNVGHFNVSGVCGTGNFQQHSFVWELREGFGNQEIVGQGSADDRCVFGKFIVPIIPNGGVTIVPDQRYQLLMELVGVTETNEEVSNPMPNNQASLDILFTTTPPD